MRIIKEGKIPENEVEKTCGKCETVFAYVPGDVYPDRDGPYVICPICRQFLSTENDKMYGVTIRNR